MVEIPADGEIPGVRIGPKIPGGGHFLRDAHRQRLTPFGVVNKRRSGTWGYWVWDFKGMWMFEPPLLEADTRHDAIVRGMAKHRELRLPGR
jgi:hypothetical protein